MQKDNYMNKHDGVKPGDGDTCRTGAAYSHKLERTPSPLVLSFPRAAQPLDWDTGPSILFQERQRV